jgi:ATP-dependent RNA helicase SUPV3L1/SUV3
VKDKRGKRDKPRVDTPPAPRPDRTDRPPRRGPSPNSPFAGLAALLAESRKD